MAATNKLNKTGLSQVWSKIVELFVAKETGKGLSTNDFDNTAKSNLDNLTAATTLTGYGITDAYTKTETDEAITASVNTAISGVYKVKGSVAFASLPTENRAAGDVYNISDAFTTTEGFVEGAGKSYPAGTNVVYTEAGWDCLAGIYDFSDLVKASDLVDITNEEIDAICVIA